MGISIVKYLRKNNIKFKLLPHDHKVSEEAVIEAKMAKKPIRGITNAYKYFLIVITKPESFSKKILTDRLNWKNSTYCTTEETQNEFGLLSSLIPPFGGVLDVDSYISNSVKNKKYLIVDMDAGGKIEFNTKEYLAVENPEVF